VSRCDPPAPPPSCIAPELAQIDDHASAGNEGLSEIKFDGYRIGALFEAGKVGPLTRRGLDSIAMFAPPTKGIREDKPARGAGGTAIGRQ
jgi:ATP-dependent DNA ligase